jgi:anti-sigma factor RsiW
VSPICGILRTSFGDYLRDTLPAPQRRILREHLAACVACRDLAVAQDSTFLFARPMDEEVSAPEAQRILAAVKTGVSFLETERRIGHASRRRLAGGAAAAAAVAMLLLAVPGGRRPEAAVARNAEAPSSPMQPAALASETAAASSDATVYDLNPGAGREEPRVMWIVDRGLDI